MKLLTDIANQTALLTLLTVVTSVWLLTLLGIYNTLSLMGTGF